jgi:ligand-binding SRPBCC domain-containing protein
MGKDKKKYIFQKSVDIKCGLEELFNFHLDTNNLPKISPSFPNASIKKISEVPLRKNSTVTVSLNFLLFRSDWEILIRELEANKLIGDLQKGNEVKMTDKVEFIPPFGVLGMCLIPLIRFQLNMMFRYRHKKTKMIFEN